ncbi:hypothetical protein HBI32_246950 [Parastagonospora nodorum]|nr:hypothetical protein HBI32_246950 [Parastagonospora nodorum]
MPIHNRRLAEKPVTAESVTAKDSNHVDTFSLDFAFLFAEDIAKTSSLSRLKANQHFFNIQQSLPDRATVVLIIILVNKTQLLLILEDRLTPSTLLARFISITKICDLLLKTLKNAAKSGILLACKHYNFNIHVSLATDTLHLLLKGLVIKMLDFMQDMLDDIYSSKQKAIIQQLIAIVSLLFILKAPFALHFICVVCNLHALTYIIQDICIYRALDSICTRANSKAYYITIVKQFYSITNKKDKRHNDSKHCNEEVLHLILIIINYTCYDKDRKHIAYIRAFSKVLLFNNNRQINNTTRILSVPFKFYDLSTIIRLVHLVPRDLPNSTTYTTISYYINNYIN